MFLWILCFCCPFSRRFGRSTGNSWRPALLRWWFLQGSWWYESWREQIWSDAWTKLLNGTLNDPWNHHFQVPCQPHEYEPTSMKRGKPSAYIVCSIFTYFSISPKWSWYVRIRDFAWVSRVFHSITPKKHLLAVYPHRNQLWARNAFSFGFSLRESHGGYRQSFGRHPVSLLRGMACATCVASASWTWNRLVTWSETLNLNEVC